MMMSSARFAAISQSAASVPNRKDGGADDHREEDRQHDVHDRPGDLAVHRHHRYVRCLEDDQRRQHDPRATQLSAARSHFP